MHCRQRSERSIVVVISGSLIAGRAKNWELRMKIRDLKIAWRIFLKQPAHSLIVFLGLSVSFCVCFLLLGYAKFSFEYNAHIADADRIFLVKHRVNVFSRPVWVDFRAIRLDETIGTSGIPHTIISLWSNKQTAETSTKISKSLNVVSVSSSFPESFAVKTLQGDLAATLAKPDAIAVTAATAEKLFNTQKVLGSTLKIAERNLTIGAVIQDPPKNTTISFDALVGTKEEQFSTYVKLPANVDVGMVEQFLQTAADKSPFATLLRERWKAGADQISVQKSPIEIRLTSLKAAYFDRDLGNFEGISRGNKDIVIALVGVAVVILLLAATGFINLMVARTIRRQREIGVYKMLGVTRLRIVRQFVTESLLLTFAANGLGLFIAWLMLPMFSDLMNRPLDSLFTLSNLAMSLLFSVMLGLLLSAYPTWIALRVNTNQALVGKGNNESVGGIRLRRILTVIQFSSAIAFGAVALAIAWQTHYVSKVSLGFSPENLLLLNLIQAPFGDDSDEQKAASAQIEAKNRAFQNSVIRLPGIRDVASTNQALGRDFVGFNSPLFTQDDRRIEPVVHLVSPNFFDVYQVRAIAGRVYDPKLDLDDKVDRIVLNEAAIKELGFTAPQDAIGKIVMSLRRDRAWQIIGVVPNVRFQNAYEQEAPRSFRLQMHSQTLVIRVDADLVETQAKIAALWHQFFPSHEFNLITNTSLVAENYAEDIRLTKLLIVAAIIVMLNAIFGIYVLSAYSVQRRFQEIAIRKIYGAKTTSIALLLGKEFGFIMLVSALIGLPLGALAISHYLASFVERAPIGGWTLLFALSVALLIALASSLRHALLAMRISPVAALRN
jgi:putative ABC transport system permease protein